MLGSSLLCMTTSALVLVVASFVTAQFPTMFVGDMGSNSTSVANTCTKDCSRALCSLLCAGPSIFQLKTPPIEWCTRRAPSFVWNSTRGHSGRPNEIDNAIRNDPKRRTRFPTPEARIGQEENEIVAWFKKDCAFLTDHKF